jgi:hypothetical protein
MYLRIANYFTHDDQFSMAKFILSKEKKNLSFSLFFSVEEKCGRENSEDALSGVVSDLNIKRKN